MKLNSDNSPEAPPSWEFVTFSLILKMMIWTGPPPTFLQLFTKYPVFFLEGAPNIENDDLN